MKPTLVSIKGRMMNLEATVNGYNIELMDSMGKYIRCFMHAETLTKFSSQFGYLKPNREIKIKCCDDYDIFGRHVFNVEQIFPIKKEGGK